MLILLFLFIFFYISLDNKFFAIEIYPGKIYRHKSELYQVFSKD